MEAEKINILPSGSKEYLESGSSDRGSKGGAVSIEWEEYQKKVFLLRE
jgi:hypothetical protein